MRTIAFTLAAFVLAVSFAVVGGSGLAGIYGANDAPQASQLSDQVNNSAADSAAGNEDAFAGEVSQTDSGDSSLIGWITSGGSAIATAAGVVAVLPAALMELGAPAMFAIPVGGLVQIIAGWGVIQFAVGRVWR
jgi:hypothetical protein